MYISINLDSLEVMHKHQFLSVVTDLCVIEAQDVSYHVFNFTDTMVPILTMTDFERIILLQNLGEANIKSDQKSVVDAIFTKLCEFPETKANPYHSELQAEVAEKKPGVYQYVDLSTRPQKKQKPIWEEEVLRPELGDHNSLKVNSPKPVNNGPKSAPSDTPAKKQQVGAIIPKPGTARATIWAKCTEIWEKRGKPTGKDEIKDIRNRVKDLLTEEGMNKNNVQIESGCWKKNMGF